MTLIYTMADVLSLGGSQLSRLALLASVKSVFIRVHPWFRFLCSFVPLCGNSFGCGSAVLGNPWFVLSSPRSTLRIIASPLRAPPQKSPPLHAPLIVYNNNDSRLAGS